MKKRGRIKGKPTTMETYMMAYGKIGATFFSQKSDKHLTATAHNYNRKITTQRHFAITTKNETLNFNTKKTNY